MSKITFVVPCYNKESYIADCLRSLTTQDFKDIEIIVVNDASTDASAEIIYFMARDVRIKVFNLKTNKGRSYARNFGIKKAKSDIICVMDADDLASPERAKETYRFFKRNPTKSVFYSAWLLGDVHGNPSRMIKAIKFDIEKVKETLFTYICHSTMAYRKSVKPRYKGGKISSLGIDDWTLQMDLFLSGHSFGFSNKPLLIYRDAPSTISKTRDVGAVLDVKTKYMKKVGL
jgi:teichuronic acid biosynthesis glycosyltransferase TuaG